MSEPTTNGASNPPSGDIQDFSGAYAESHWDFVAGSGNGFVDKTNLPGTLKITGSNNSIADNTDYLVTVDRDGHIMFNWSFSSADTPGFPYDGFGYLLNGKFTSLATKEDSNVFLQDVKAGDRFGFRLTTLDANNGAGKVVITNFSLMTDGMAPTSTYEPTMANIGGVTCGKTGLGFAVKNGTDSPIQIKLKGENIASATFADLWDVVAAAKDGSGYSVYVKNKDSNQFGKWGIDNKGEIIKSEPLSMAQLLEDEKTFGYDINDDRKTGLSYEVESSRGGVDIGKTELGYAVRKGEGEVVHVKSGGNYVTPLALNWDILAATQDGPGYGLYLKDKNSGRYAKWELDDKGSVVKGQYLSNAQLLEAEQLSGHDINDDGQKGFHYQDESARGSVRIGKTEAGYALKKGDGPSVQVKSNGDYVSPITFGWQLLAAIEEGSGYGVFLKDKGSDQYAKWSLDDQASIVKGEYLTLSQVLEIESIYGYDINDDSKSGLIYREDSSRGGVSLGTTEIGYAVKKGNNPSVQIKSNGAYVSPATLGWTLLAATEELGGYGVYLENKQTHQFAKWSLDDKGSIVKGKFLTSSELLEVESASGHDINDDGKSGLSFEDQSVRGNVQVGKTALGYAFRKSESEFVHLKSGDNYVSPLTLTWDLETVVKDGSGYKIYLKNKDSDQYAKWSVDDSGAIVKGDYLSKADLLEAESDTGYDINDDKKTGVTFQPESARGSAGVGETELGYALSGKGGKIIQIKSAGTYVTSSSYLWEVEAAIESETGYSVYLKNKDSDQYAKWLLDDKGSIVKGEYLSFSQLLEAEALSGYDINGDSSKGATYQSKSERGGVGFGSTQLGLALKKGEGPVLQIKSAGAYVSPDSLGWEVTAATEDGGGFDIFIRNKQTGQFAKWSVDDHGSIQAGDYLSRNQLLESESSSGHDLDGDDKTGPTYVEESSRGGVHIGRTELGYILKRNNGESVHIKSNGAYVSPEGLDWSFEAATENGGGFNLYIKNKKSGQYAKWEIDDKGSVVKGDYLNADQLREAEMASGYDINDDHSIGDPMIMASTSTTLGEGEVHLMLEGTSDIDGTGNALDNIIEGNSGKNALDGKDGIDVLIGHEGADSFIFSTIKKYGLDVADHITDFKSSEGDTIKVSRVAFGIDKNAVNWVTTVATDVELGNALRTDALFVYDSRDGSLALNQNGTGNGYGKGGIFAVLDNTAPLTATNINLF